MYTGGACAGFQTDQTGFVIRLQDKHSALLQESVESGCVVHSAVQSAVPHFNPEVGNCERVISRLMQTQYLLEIGVCTAITQVMYASAPPRDVMDVVANAPTNSPSTTTNGLVI